MRGLVVYVPARLRACRDFALHAAVASAMSWLCVLAADAAQPPVERQPFGRTADGRTVEIFTLRNERGMRVRFLSRGATIVEISAPDRDGKFANVALGMKDFMALDDPGDWFNSILGRYANRISNGGFTLDGRFFPLKSNVGNVVLHGGPAGFSAKLWSATILDQPAHAVRLRYVSPDGENGFPGELTVTVTYSLDEADVLQLQYEATTTKPTVVNLSNHTYFNLGGHPSGPIYGEWLQVFAGRWTPTDAALVPTGQVVPVAGTPLDFRQPTPLGAHVYSTVPLIMMAHGLDHNLILDPPPRDGALRLAARLWDPPSGRQMEVRTSEPGLQLYSGNGFNGEVVADDGRTLRQGDGITFETQHFPDSPNKPDFPSTVLRPGEVFRSTTQYAFSTDREHGWFAQSGSAKAK